MIAPYWYLTTSDGSTAGSLSTMALTIAPTACSASMKVIPFLNGSATFTVYSANLTPGAGSFSQGSTIMSCTSTDGVLACTASASVSANQLMYLQATGGGTGTAFLAFSCQ